MTLNLDIKVVNATSITTSNGPMTPFNPVFGIQVNDYVQLSNGSTIKIVTFGESGIYDFGKIQSCPLNSLPVKSSSSIYTSYTSKSTSTILSTIASTITDLSSWVTTEHFLTTNPLNSTQSTLMTTMESSLPLIYSKETMESHSKRSTNLPGKTRIVRAYTSSSISSDNYYTQIESDSILMVDISSTTSLPVITTTLSSNTDFVFVPTDIQNLFTSGIAIIIYGILLIAIIGSLIKKLSKKNGDDESILTVKQYRKKAANMTTNSAI